MKILHIWDQAGVACTLAKYQNLTGHESKVIVLGDVDKYSIYDFYRRYCVRIESNNFTKMCLSEAENADLIHVHSRSDIFLEAYRKFRQSKKMILHYHGTDIRGYKGDDLIHLDKARKFLAKSRRSILKIRNRCRLITMGYWRSANLAAQKISTTTLVATPDLVRLVKNGIYLPNPIDTDHFKKVPQVKREKKALTFNTEVTDTNRALEFLKSSAVNLELEVYDRTKKPVMFRDMPPLLNRYQLYVDVRYVNNFVLENLSKTAIESLACGLEVLNYKLKLVTTIPQVHLPFNVISILSTLYES
jgi:glycosyltransferase involved in cell wall biosynthesis